MAYSSTIISIDDGNGKTRFDGASSPDGLVIGTYIHGLFAEDKFRRSVLKTFGAEGNKSTHFDQEIETTLDNLANHLEQYIDGSYYLHRGQ